MPMLQFFNQQINYDYENLSFDNSKDFEMW